MDRQQKQSWIDTFHGVFEETSLVIVTHYKGLTVAEMNTLRGRMRDAGASFKVTKNRLTRLALSGTKFENLSDLFTGPTAICFATDPVALAKATTQYAKENDKLVILGAALGPQVLNPEGVQALAKLPSLDELRARLVGLIQAPATRVAGVLQAPAAQLARVFNAYATKDEAA